MMHHLATWAPLYALLLIFAICMAWLWLCQCERCGRHFAIYKIRETTQLCGACATGRRL